MFDILNKILCKDRAPAQDDLTAHVALAVLLFEAAHADGTCSAAEKAHLIQTLITDFKVSRDDIDSLLDATRKERKDYVDLFRVTRYINDNFSEDQKIRVLEAVWEILLLDGHLEAHEDHFAHKLANLFTLNHDDLINAKLRARKKLTGTDAQRRL